MPTACFLLDHFWGDREGGAEWQTFVLCRALREASWDVHYIAESTKGRTGATEEAHGIVVHWLAPLQWRSRYHGAQRQMFRTVTRILDEVKPVALYSRGNNAFTGIGLCHRYKRLRGIKTIWGAAAEWEISRNFYRQRLDYYSKSRWKKALLSLDARIKDRDHAAEIATADVVIAQTEDQRRLVVERFGREAAVLPSSHDIPAETFPKDRPPLIVFVAHIGRRKRVERFVELARRCSDLEAEFVVIGDFVDQRYEEEVKQAARGLRNVRFLGPRSLVETNNLIARASILVSTTDPGWEGYPNVFIQAWMRNTLVATLNHDPDGLIAKNEFLGIHGGSLDQMMVRLRSLIADQAKLEQWGKAAREWAIARHGCAANKDRIVEIFESVAQSTCV